MEKEKYIVFYVKDGGMREQSFADKSEAEKFAKKVKSEAIKYGNGGSLDKQWNFPVHGVTTFRKLIDVGAFDAKYKSIENAQRFNRLKDFRMDGAEQQEYYKKLNKKKTVYNLRNAKDERSSHEVTKEIYDYANLPELEERNYYTEYKGSGGDVGIAKRGMFAIDAIEGKEFKGYTFGNDWNGWAVPYFEKEEANEIVSAMGGKRTEGKIPYYVFNDDDDEQYKEQVINTVDGKKKVYPIGAYAWVWDEVVNGMAHGGEITSSFASHYTHAGGIGLGNYFGDAHEKKGLGGFILGLGIGFTGGFFGHARIMKAKEDAKRKADEAIYQAHKHTIGRARATKAHVKKKIHEGKESFKRGMIESIQGLGRGGEVGGSGWGKFKKGKRITDLSQLQQGDILLSHNNQFNAENLVEITDMRKGEIENKEGVTKLIYGRFVDPKDTSKLRHGANPEGFAIWDFDLKHDEFYAPASAMKITRNGKTTWVQMGEGGEIVNGYQIQYNDLWKKFIVSHHEIGAGIAEFKTKEEAIEYAKNG